MKNRKPVTVGPRGAVRFFARLTYSPPPPKILCERTVT
nr:MAG TPA: hypothetical protein [Caudoviricetes sp.]